MKENFEAHKGHRDRLRQRILSQGMDSLQSHEILEFLLCYSIPRQNTNPIAHALMERFGNLNDVLFAGMDELVKVKGVGPRTAFWLASLGETVRSFRSLQPGDRCRISRPMDLFAHAMQLRRQLRPPCTLQICLDAHGFLVLQRQLTPSRAWGEEECLSNALRDMLETRAVYSVILQFTQEDHSQAEEYDRIHAEDFAQTLNLLDCTLLDVVMVGETQLISLRERGELPSLSAGMRTGVLRENYESCLYEYADLRCEAQEKY